MSVNQDILDDIKRLKIDCPDCKYMTDDDQYTCTTCWYQGGNGKINVLEWIAKNPEILKNVKT